VVVTVGNQKLVTTVKPGGRWSVKAGALAEDSHPVVATIMDAAGNIATASQVLTVDTTAPLLKITGGTRSLTASSSPTISGTTDAPAGRTVTVKVDGKTLLAQVTAPISGTGSNTWTVTASALSDGDRVIVATVTDAAGNTRTARQTLTVDTTAPTVFIDGEATVYIKDLTPTISGSTNAPENSIVTVQIGTLIQTSRVEADGGWSVKMPTLSECICVVTVSVRDLAGNIGTASQNLVVDTTKPIVTIAGGAKTTSRPTSPISGTTNAPAGSAVVVSVSGRFLTTTVATDGRWSVTPTGLAAGRTSIRVTITDPAGNTGTSTQIYIVAGSPVVAPPVANAEWVVNYANPVIQGTTDAPIGTKVIVTIDTQVFHAFVQKGGLWGQRLNPMKVGRYNVTVEMQLSSGVSGKSSRVLVFKAASGSTAPLVLTTGCPKLSPNGEATLTAGGKTLTASVHQYGVWNLLAAKTADCDYVVVASVADQSGDTGTFSRVRKNANSAPTVTITGGANAVANPSIRKIAGTSTAPAGSRVQVRMSSQTMTTEVRADGSWSVFRNDFAVGTHQLVVSVRTSAGLTGYASQAVAFAK
jgi:hypothetical protein